MFTLKDTGHVSLLHQKDEDEVFYPDYLRFVDFQFHIPISSRQSLHASST